MADMNAVLEELGCSKGEAVGLVLELVAECEQLRAARVRAEQELVEARRESWQVMRAVLERDGRDAEFVRAAGRLWELAPRALCGVFGVEVIKADNPYGCNQYGEGWKEEHLGNSTKYEQTGFSGKQAKMLTNTAGGNKVSVATKEKKPGKGAYPDASEEGLQKAKEGGKKLHGGEDEKPEKKEEKKRNNPIGKAETKAEAIEHTKQILGEGAKVSFHENITAEMINEFNAGLKELTDKYGQFGLEQAGSALMPAGYGAWANETLLEINHNHGHSGVHNYKAWKPYETPTAEGYTRHNVGATENGITIKDVMTHEFGHVIQAKLSRMYEQYLQHKKRMSAQWIKAAYSENMLKGMELMAEWRNVLGRARRSKDIIKISKYANTNDREFFSECFAMRERGEKLPEYITLAMDKIIKYKQEEYKYRRKAA